MSVTIDGIKGYEYQYKVTVLIGLLADVEKVELFVEKNGSEDATLKIRQNNSERIIEIQVKREKSLLNIKKIVEWLCHFQERKDNNNLLQRLIDSETIISLFVTYSRCSDDIVTLKNKVGTVKAHDKINISNKWKTDFVSSLSNITLGSTKLMSGRKNFCEGQSKIVNNINDLSNILKRVLIWEEYSDEKIDAEIIKILNTEYQIAQSKAPDVYLKLLQIVQDGRDSGKNILPHISTTIQKNKIGRPQIDTEYSLRDEEHELLDFLEKDEVLLLTGISQCGKSEIAKSLATYYFDRGYDFRISQEIDEIQRFLGSNPDNKIGILEDPWGHVSLLEESSERKTQLENLLTNIESNNKLIVTCRLEILFELFNTDTLDKCRLHDKKWTDLTIKKNPIIKKYWQELSTSKGIPLHIINLFSNIIENSIPAHLIQIGQIRYLANQELDALSNKSASELEHIARSNSNDIANSIKQKDEYIAEILSVLSICCNTIQKVSKIDLAYVLSDRSLKKSIINEKFYTINSVVQVPKYPEYTRKILLNDEVERALEYLEERQLIIVANDEILFSHPNYYEAGRYLLFPRSERKRKRILNYLGNCSTCLNPINAYLGTKQFLFIYKNIKKELRNEVINYSLRCFDSIYPSVRDGSLIFLINIIENLDETQLKRVFLEIQNGDVSSSQIYWHKKIPFISMNASFGLSIKADKSIIERTISQLKQQQLPGLYNSWVFITNMSEHKEDNIELLNILLGCNEVFIRSRVVSEIFKKISINDVSVLLNIFNDEHPSVVFNAIRFSFINWINYSKELQDFLSNQIKQVLGKRQIAIRAFNFISTFAIDYGSESINWKDFNTKQIKEIWNLWGEFFPITLKNIPLGLFFNTGRFELTMDKAMEYIEINAGMNVLTAWYERIDYQIKNKKLLDGHEMSIVNKLIKLTKDNYVIRKDLFSKLINYNDTCFMLSNIKRFMAHWSFLDSSEREQIKYLLNSERIDLRWIKAVLLNSNPVPAEIAFSIFGDDIIFKDGIDSILAKFSDNLLVDCLKVYCGEPYPLSRLEMHLNISFWSNVIRKILLSEEHCAFKICLDDFLSNCVTCGFVDDWKDGKQVWKEVCERTKNKKGLTNSLIYHTSNITYEYEATKDLWTVLIISYRNEQKESEIISLIVENIEMLQQSSSYNDIFKIFDHSFILDKIVPKLIPDGFLIYVLNQFCSNTLASDEEKTAMLSLMIKRISDKKIRFLGTFYFIEKLEEKDIPVSIIEKLKSLPNSIDEIGKKELEKRRKEYEYKIQDWIGVCASNN